MTHICINKLTIIYSDNGLSPGRRQAIIWTNSEIFLTGPLGTNFGESSIEIHTYSFNEMPWKMSSGKCRPQYVNVSNQLVNLRYRRTLISLRTYQSLPRITNNLLAHMIGHASLSTHTCIYMNIYMLPWAFLWISNYAHHDVWHEITYPIPHNNIATVEVWEWICIFITHLTGYVVITWHLLCTYVFHVRL